MSKLGSPSGYVEAAHKYGGKGDPLMEAAAHRNLKAFLAEYDVRPYRGRARDCLKHLEKPRHRCTSMECYHQEYRQIPGGTLFDHIERWRAPNQGRWVVTAHPYDNYRTDDFVEHWRKRGVVARVKPPEASWYFPGNTYLVIVEGLPAPR